MLSSIFLTLSFESFLNSYLSDRRPFRNNALSIFANEELKNNFEKVSSKEIKSYLEDK